MENRDSVVKNATGLKQFAQGDILLLKIDKLPENIVEIRRDERDRLLLALGEVTGHAHAVHEKGVKMYMDKTMRPEKQVGDASEESYWNLVANSRKYLEVLKDCKIVHGHYGGVDCDHHQIKTSPGLYEIFPQFEFDYFMQAERLVKD